MCPKVTNTPLSMASLLSNYSKSVVHVILKTFTLEIQVLVFPSSQLVKIPMSQQLLKVTMVDDTGKDSKEQTVQPPRQNNQEVKG